MCARETEIGPLAASASARARARRRHLIVVIVWFNCELARNAESPVSGCVQPLSPRRGETTGAQVSEAARCLGPDKCSRAHCSRGISSRARCASLGGRAIAVCVSIWGAETLRGTPSFAPQLLAAQVLTRKSLFPSTNCSHSSAWSWQGDASRKPTQSLSCSMAQLQMMRVDARTQITIDATEANISRA